MKDTTNSLITCEQCGKRVHRKPSQIKRSSHSFCSVACKAKWQKTHFQGKANPNYRKEKLYAICVVCGKSFKVFSSQIGRGKKYCSVSCYNKVRAKKKPLKETLLGLYHNKKLSTIKIGEQLGLSSTTVNYWLRKYGIHIRTHSELAIIKNPAKSGVARNKIGEKSRDRWENKKYRENIINQLKGKKHTEKHKKKISKSLIGNQRRTGIPHTEKVKRNLSQASKRNWKNIDYVRKVMAGLHYTPNKSELTVIRMIEENALPFRYVGDGEFIIDGKCPDFISTDGSKKVVEVFGEPWHDPDESDKIYVDPERTEEGRTKFLNEHEYDCLIIWHKELSDEKSVLDKLKAFSMNKGGLL